jgi:hypothetical protein
MPKITDSDLQIIEDSLTDALSLIKKLRGSSEGFVAGSLLTADEAARIVGVHPETLRANGARKKDSGQAHRRMCEVFERELAAVEIHCVLSSESYDDSRRGVQSLDEVTQCN